MKPSTSPLMSGAGSYCTGTMVSSDSSMSLAASSALNSAVLESCTPIFLPMRSSGVAMLPPSLSESTVNGFFWNVVPMIFSGAPSEATTAPIETASRQRDVGGARDELGGAGRRSGHERHRAEAGVGVVALGVGEELARELLVLDPAELDGQVAEAGRVAARGLGRS